MHWVSWQNGGWFPVAEPRKDAIAGNLPGIVFLYALTLKHSQHRPFRAHGS